VQAKRGGWPQAVGRVPAERRVFVDETGANTARHRPHGRCPTGERLVSAVPVGHGKTTPFVAALRADGLSAPAVVDGAMDRGTCEGWVEPQLVPTPRAGGDGTPGDAHRPAGAGVGRAGPPAGAVPAPVQPGPEPDREGVERTEGHAGGLVHRDIKPGNIVVFPAGSPHDQVKLVDFGLVHSLAEVEHPEQRITRDGLIVGTPEYMSPEQARGGILDGRSDLFSLGSVAYYLVTGREAFHRDNPMKTLTTRWPRAGAATGGARGGRPTGGASSAPPRTPAPT
jgi:hypothetical protein